MAIRDHLSDGYAAHVGPVLRAGRSDGHGFRLRLRPWHLNADGRLHGGMALSVHAICLGQVADEMAPDGGVAVLLSLHCDFIAATVGDVDVSAEIQVTRAARSVAFLSSELRCGDRILSSATAIYRYLGVAERTAAAVGRPPRPGAAPAQGWSLARTEDPFGAHVGPLYERGAEGPDPDAGFAWGPERCSPVVEDAVHDGLSLFVADLFSGRAAARAADGGRVVTLSMQLQCFGAPRRAAWVEFRPRLVDVTDDLVVVDGAFSSGPTPSMRATSIWKRLG